MELGTALSVASLSFQLFAGCIKGFVLVSDARNLGKDATLERTKLMLQEHRLIEWANAIRLDTIEDEESPKLNKDIAGLILGQLEQLLTSTETLKKRYKLELVSPPDSTVDITLSTNFMIPERSEGSILSNIVSPQARRSILERSSKANSANAVHKRLWWAAVDKKKYAQLVEDVTGLVDGLWSLLDINHRVQTSRTIHHTLQLAIQTSKDIEGLQTLQESLKDPHAEASIEDGLAASAGLKAKHMLLVTANDQSGLKEANLSVAEHSTQSKTSLVLNPYQLTKVDMMTPTIGWAMYQEISVIMEEKHVPLKMKSKLKSRVESLANLLSQPPTPSFRTLPCLGYTEEQTGFRVIFDLPPGSDKNTGDRQLVSLATVLSRSKGILPDAGTRLELAVRVCQTLLSFHTACWLHKDMRSENILLLSKSSHQVHSSLSQPYLCGFSFARRDSPTEISEQPSADASRDIYRHPEALGEPSESFERYMDAYALGCVLVEIAEWTPLRKIIKKRVDTSAPGGVAMTDLELLPQWLHNRYITEGVAAFRLGAAFAKMVGLCIPAPREKPELAEFYSALENMSACVI